MIVRSALLFFTLLFFFNISVFTQAVLPDSSVYQESIYKIRKLYKGEIKENAHLYAGNTYLFSSFNQKKTGFPFFASDTLLEGNIYYDGTLYDSVFFRYDLVGDKVVLNDYLTNLPIELFFERIKYFSLNHHEFFSIPTTIAAKLHTSRHFYDKLYAGNISLWALREKKLQKNINTDDQSEILKEYNQYYLQKDSAFYLVDNETSLLMALQNKKENLKKFIRQNNIKFKKELEGSLVKVVQYYDQINN